MSKSIYSNVSAFPSSIFYPRDVGPFLPGQADSNRRGAKRQLRGKEEKMEEEEEVMRREIQEDPSPSWPSIRNGGHPKCNIERERESWKQVARSFATIHNATNPQITNLSSLQHLVRKKVTHSTESSLTIP